MLFFTIGSFSQTSIIWENSYGGSKSDVARCIETTSDGGYVVVGYSNSQDGDVSGTRISNDYWIIKLDSEGVLQWEKSYGGTEEDKAYCVVQTDDNGFLVVGTSDSHDGDVVGNHSLMLGLTDFWVLRLNPMGEIVWKKCFGGSVLDHVEAVTKDPFGNYIIAGTAFSSNGDVTDHIGDADFWIIKINNTGNVLWKKSYGGMYTEQARAVANTNNGYIIAGSSSLVSGDVTVNYGNSDVWVLRIDYDGNIIWQNSYGGSNSDQAYSVVPDQFGNFYVACHTKSDDGLITEYFGREDFWILKIDSLGNLLWQKTVGSAGTEQPYSICTTDDGGCIAAGYFQILQDIIVVNQSFLLVKLNEHGDINWVDTLGGSEYDIAYSIKNLGNNQYIVAGSSESNDGDVSGHHSSLCGTLPDFWVVKFTDITYSISENNISSRSIHCYPNPFSDYTKIQYQSNGFEDDKLLLFDLTGRLLREIKCNNGECDLYRESLKTGMYMIQIVSDKQIIGSGKIIVE